MSQIFDAKTRKKIVDVHITCGFNPGQTRAYIETLEDIARAAEQYVTNSTPVNAIKLNAALDVVDRMRNE